MNGNMSLGARIERLEKDGASNIREEISRLDSEIETIKTEASKGHVYSTEEKVVGTWSDGRSVYEKTYTGTGSSTSTDNYTFNNDIVNLDVIIESAFTAKITATESQASEVPNMQILGGNFSVSYIATTNEFAIRQTQTSDTSTFDFVFTLRYVKTT